MDQDIKAFCGVCSRLSKFVSNSISVVIQFIDKIFFEKNNYHVYENFGP